MNDLYKTMTEFIMFEFECTGFNSYVAKLISDVCTLVDSIDTLNPEMLAKATVFKMITGAGTNHNVCAVCDVIKSVHGIVKFIPCDNGILILDK